MSERTEGVVDSSPFVHSLIYSFIHSSELSFLRSPRTSPQFSNLNFTPQHSSLFDSPDHHSLKRSRHPSFWPFDQLCLLNSIILQVRRSYILESWLGRGSVSGGINKILRYSAFGQPDRTTHDKLLFILFRLEGERSICCFYFVESYHGLFVMFYSRQYWMGGS